ncbi:hypothetical protein M409DRAFT_48700 [Zasmidium cellare ATCC 36951]|uniref:Uncharacterized protein n=1 Tax=Zasmidium cellare ATCC 36951 TaxID=1080233 RepID=A0A6A6D6C7_ZASCE|nr:uncharacterized protein M409DRAFT_48700 [Zasmidium cellare ATCC 36951]KAF2173772.1 hypothetical protein M409DRAFT_48700 [Zasmidium cellare ATCC 36951]
MHLTSYLLLALGVGSGANAAALASKRATNSVFYAAFSGMNEGGGTKGCTGANLGTVQASGTSTSACKQVGEGACVTLTGFQGNATKCKVLTYEEPNCGGDGESTIFGNKGDYANEDFASFKAVCGS